MSFTRTLHNRKLIGKLLSELSPVYSAAMSVYSRTVNWEKSVYAIDTRTDTNKVIPAIGRGTAPIAIGADSEEIKYFKPLPIEATTFIDAVEIKDVETYTEEGRNEWLRRRLEILRNILMNTKNSMASLGLTGTIAWKKRANSGLNIDYTTAIGTIDTIAGLAGNWSNSATKLSSIVDDINLIKDAFKDDNRKGKLAFHPGRTVWASLFDKINSTTNPSKFEAKATFDEIQIMGQSFYNEQFEYFNIAGTKTTVVGATDMHIIDTSAQHEMVNMPIYNLNAGLRPYPIWTNTEVLPDGSGIKLHAKATPFFAPDVIAIKQVTSIT